MSKPTKKHEVSSCPVCGSENLNGLPVKAGKAYRCNSCGKVFMPEPKYNTKELRNSPSIRSCEKQDKKREP